jgi:hypothetical protein
MIHTDIRLAQRDIERVLDDLNVFLEGDDEQLKLDMFEGETDLFSIASRLLEANENDEGIIEALEQQIGARKVRKDRAELRIERRKSAISSLMDCAHITKLPLPEATVSLRTLKPRPKVVDVDALPAGFFTEQTLRKPDHDVIADAFERGEEIPGVIVTNGGSSLSVRRK